MKHPFFISDDDLWSVQILKSLETIVPVDHASIQIVEIRCSETTAIERNERTEIRRNDGNDFHHHPLRAVSAVTEGFDDLQPFGVLTSLRFGGGVAHQRTKFVTQGFNVQLSENVTDDLATHANIE